MLTIADALGLDTFSVVGISGGGPPALVCAAVLPADRLSRVGTICGLGPNDWPGVTEGMQALRDLRNSSRAFEVAAETIGNLVKARG